MLVKDKLKNLRKDMHITAAELADRIGVTQATISRYENGYIRRIPDDVLEQIADALDTSMEELTSDDPVYSHLHKDQYKKEKTPREQIPIKNCLRGITCSLRKYRNSFSELFPATLYRSNRVENRHLMQRTLLCVLYFGCFSFAGI